MKSLNKRVLILLLCLICMLQTGCWDQKIYEDIGFMLQMGLELDESKELLYTITVPVFTQGAKGKSEALSTKGDFLRESRENIRRTLGKKIEGGKTQHIYISKELAKNASAKYFDVFLRNPENPLLANIIVVDGSPKELMEASVAFKDKPLPAMYVNDLLVEARENAYTPETRIYDFVIKVYSKTIDITTPLVAFDAKSINIKGTALFDGDKMVGEIDTKETGMLYLLMGKNANIQYIYNDKGGTAPLQKGAATYIKKFTRKVDIYMEEDVLKIDVKLDMKAAITEYTGDRQLDKREELKKLEEEVGKAVERDCEKLLKYLQLVNSDPVGFGEMIRAKHSAYWKSIQWDDIYKDVDFNVDANLKFEFYGAIN